PCVRGLGTTIATRRRATSRQALLRPETAHVATRVARYPNRAAGTKRDVGARPGRERVDHAPTARIDPIHEVLLLVRNPDRPIGGDCSLGERPSDLEVGEDAPGDGIELDEVPGVRLDPEVFRSGDEPSGLAHADVDSVDSVVARAHACDRGRVPAEADPNRAVPRSEAG